MSYLTRSWQILLKGFEEVRSASIALPALEMVLIRLGYCSTMPSLEELVAGGTGAEGVTAAVSVAAAAPIMPANESGNEVLEIPEAMSASDAAVTLADKGAGEPLPTTMQDGGGEGFGQAST
jgi:DNA polymerase-3 subunit gamma/tau